MASFATPLVLRQVRSGHVRVFTVRSSASGEGVSVALFRRTVAPQSRPEVLLVRRGREPNLGRWSFPGGKLHPGESLREGALRELREETGITNELVEIQSHPFYTRTVPVSTQFHWNIHVFVAVCQHLVTPRAADDAQDARFFSADAARQLDTTDGLQAIIERAACVASDPDTPFFVQNDAFH